MANKISLENAGSVEYNGKEADSSSWEEECRRGGSGNVSEVLYFSRCLVDGRVRELVTGRDITVEKSDLFSCIYFLMETFK